MAGSRDLFVVLGNQLFPFDHVKAHRDATFFMAEDVGLCTYVKHHQLKLVLFLAAMRSHAEALRSQGCDVHYESLDEQDNAEQTTKYEAKLKRFVAGKGFERLIIFEVADKFFEERIEAFADAQGLRLVTLASPMFLTPRETFAEYLEDADHKPHMADFYRDQRRRLNLLVDKRGKPDGGRWSFDGQNRETLPEMVPVPETAWATPTEHVEAVKKVVAARFADHPGDASNFWLPTTRRQALGWLRDFLRDRFRDFGPYEDALSNRDPVLFHSALSPVMNLGLITPAEVIERAVEHAAASEASGGDIPFNSLEGFVRQIIGWREFIHGIYRHYSEEQDQRNAWNHHRSFRGCWWDGTTGLPPLDDAIRKAVKLGWTHHIERLMVLGNLMNLCEIEPRQVHDWFMCMYVDSSDWVMGPNVYGMGLVSDGGIFATKPYSAGSNYLRKMGDATTAQKGEWCDVVDGLYWRFVDRQRDFFAGNPRLAVMPGTLDKMKPERRSMIFEKAERFLDEVTTGPA